MSTVSSWPAAVDPESRPNREYPATHDPAKYDPATYDPVRRVRGPRGPPQMRQTIGAAPLGSHGAMAPAPQWLLSEMSSVVSKYAANLNRTPTPAPTPTPTPSPSPTLSLTTGAGRLQVAQTTEAQRQGCHRQVQGEP